MGKYIDLQDAYKSIYESFIHAGAVNEVRVKVIPVSSERLEGRDVDLGEVLDEFDGILIAPGFGERGIEGKINAIQYLREHKIPFFGICLGMQCAVVEYSRNVAGITGAMSTEVDEAAKEPVIDLMPDQKDITTKGGTMRLGAYACQLEKGSLAAEGLRYDHHQRTPPAPLRIQQRLPGAAKGSRPQDHRYQP